MSNRPILVENNEWQKPICVIALLPVSISCSLYKECTALHLSSVFKVCTTVKFTVTVQCFFKVCIADCRSTKCSTVCKSISAVKLVSPLLLHTSLRLLCALDWFTAAAAVEMAACVKSVSRWWCSNFSHNFSKRCEGKEGEGGQNLTVKRGLHFVSYLVGKASAEWNNAVWDGCHTELW